MKMKKKDILKTLDIASLVSIFIATVLVIVYQFSANYQVIRFSIVMYAAAFLILTVFYAIKTYFVFAKTKEDGIEIFNLSKKEKGFLIAKLALSGIAFVFTLVILILY